MSSKKSNGRKISDAEVMALGLEMSRPFQQPLHRSHPNHSRSEPTGQRQVAEQSNGEFKDQGLIPSNGKFESRD